MPEYIKMYPYQDFEKHILVHSLKPVGLLRVIPLGIFHIKNFFHDDKNKMVENVLIDSALPILVDENIIRATVHDSQKMVSDEEIVRIISSWMLFDYLKGLWLLEALVNKQSNGEEGILLTDGSFNRVFLKSKKDEEIVMSVSYCKTAHPYWHIGQTGIDDNPVKEGSRYFFFG